MTDTRPSQPCLNSPTPIHTHTHTHTPSLRISHIHTSPCSVEVCLSVFPSFSFSHVPSLIIPLPTCPLPFIFFAALLVSHVFFSDLPPIRNALSFLTPSAGFHSLFLPIFTLLILCLIPLKGQHFSISFSLAVFFFTLLFIVSSLSKDNFQMF